MKQINITSVRVTEVILRPLETIPLAVAFEILDDTGKVVLTKRLTVKKEDMPAAATTAITNLVDRITTRLTNLEGI